MATAGDDVLPMTWTFTQCSVSSPSGSLSLYQKKRSRSLCSLVTEKGWNICLMSAIKAAGFWRKYIRMPNKPFVRSGLYSRILFNEIPFFHANFVQFLRVADFKMGKIPSQIRLSNLAFWCRFCVSIFQQFLHDIKIVPLHQGFLV